jgi:hypothetical protein
MISDSPATLPDSASSVAQQDAAIARGDDD